MGRRVRRLSTHSLRQAENPGMSFLPRSLIVHVGKLSSGLSCRPSPGAGTALLLWAVLPVCVRLAPSAGLMGRCKEEIVNPL